jgi:hypothetical protein
MSLAGSPADQLPAARGIALGAAISVALWAILLASAGCI